MYNLVMTSSCLLFVVGVCEVLRLRYAAASENATLVRLCRVHSERDYVTCHQDNKKSAQLGSFFFFLNLEINVQQVNLYY
jgi:hypothetical protein